MLAREAWNPEVSSLEARGSGGTNLEPEKRRGKVLQHVEVLCAPDVSRVEIDNQSRRRVADVSSGPGWIVALWLKGAEPTLSAFDAAGRQLDVLRPETLERERATRGRSRWPWLSRSSRGRIVTLDDQVLIDLEERLRDVETAEERRAIREQILARLGELPGIDDVADEDERES